MKSNVFRLLLITSIVVIQSCSKGTNGTPQPNPPVDTSSKPISVWETRGDKGKLLQKTTIDFDTRADEASIVNIDLNVQYQRIDGFGAALTGSSANVINRNLSATNRTQLLRDLFTKEGIGIDYLRLTIGASDFSLRNFSYNETADDTLMNNFSLAEENADLLPVLKEIISINPKLKIMASPWSAPAWMKTTNNLNGGKLKPEYFRAYARYLVKYIQGMKTEGITVDAVSVQNEPLHETTSYPSMLMSAEEQRDFIKLHLGPMLQANNLTTKIIAYDHNWDQPLYGDVILKDPQAAAFVDGTAFHAYAGTFTAMGVLKELHPSKNLYFTEISGGRWATNFLDNLKWYGENIIVGTTRNWSRNALFWNLALNENDGPKNNGCTNCRGVVTVATNGQVTRNEEYYSIGHVGKFVQQGAKRVASNDISADQIKNVVFLNPDGTRVMFAFNRGTTRRSVTFKTDNKKFTFPLESNAIYTFTWK